MSTVTDFIIYDEELHTGITEVLEQAVDPIASGANGTIQLITQNLMGDYEKETFFDLVDGLVQERDPTSLADVTPTGLAQSEHVSPKVNRRIGPHQDTLDKFKKIDADPAVMSFILGRQSGRGVLLDYMNTGMIALATAIQSVSGMVYDHVAAAGSTTNLTPQAINLGMAKMGDAAGRLRSMVMHSKPYFDLVGDAMSQNLTGLSDVVIYGAAPGTRGLPVYVTDSEGLTDPDPTGDGLSDPTYFVLALSENALILTQSEERSVHSDTVGGKQNIVAEWQAEYAYNVKVKGFSYTGASASPTKAQLGDGANWTYVFDDIKSGPGVAIVVN